MSGGTAPGSGRVLTTPRLVLRHYTPQDAAFHLRLVNEPGWHRFIGDRGIRTEDDARAAIQDGPLASLGQHGFALMVVEDRATREPIGTCGLLRRPALPGPDLGFAFLGEHVGRGLATEAGRAVLEMAWRDLTVDHVFAITAPDNVRSLRVLARLGFTAREPVVVDPPGVTSRLLECRRPSPAPAPADDASAGARVDPAPDPGPGPAPDPDPGEHRRPPSA